jgi:GT2 family glycosyltransferase
MAAPALYIPIANTFYEARKRNQILHVSRIARPNLLADKGHIQMIRAFQMLVDSGLKGWEFIIAGSLEDSGYSNELHFYAQGYPVSLILSPSQQRLEQLYSESALYWHATGASMPEIHGAQEHLGLTTLEAMASGAVPVVLGTGGQTEIIHQGIDGILCEDVRGIGLESMDLIGNLAQWSRMSWQAKASARPWQDVRAFAERVARWLDGEEYELLPLPKTNWSEDVPLTNHVCAVMVVHNEIEYARHAVASILRSVPDLGQLLVIDNASDAGVADQLNILLRSGTGDQVVRLTKHVSFAEANNLACQHTDKHLLLAINSDMIFFDGECVEMMLAALGHDVGIVGAKLIFPDGTLQHAGGIIDWNTAVIGSHRYYMMEDNAAANQREDVDFVTGAMLLARRELWRWRTWGGIGYEDTDLCLQARRDGWRVVYQPAARALHYQGVTRRTMAATETDEVTTKNRDAFRALWYTKIAETFPWWLQGKTRR